MRIITIFLLLFVLPLTIWASDPVNINYPVEGDPVPTFMFELEKGNIQSINDYNNKTVLLVFFATWCSYCRAELPVIQKEIWETYRGNEHFKLLVIGREHNRNDIEKFMSENHFTFPVVPDTKREIFSMFAAQNIPRSYLIDKNGKIVKMMIGYQKSEFKKLKKQIKAELEINP